MFSLGLNFGTISSLDSTDMASSFFHTPSSLSRLGNTQHVGLVTLQGQDDYSLRLGFRGMGQTHGPISALGTLVQYIPLHLADIKYPEA